MLELSSFLDDSGEFAGDTWVRKPESSTSTPRVNAVIQRQEIIRTEQIVGENI
jgi:hypothetical protein